MGVFTEQVQRLATEQETLRREREERRKIKKKQEEAERTLYYIIENIFTCTTFTRKNIFRKFENKKSIYNFLKEYETKNYLIERITKNVDVQYIEFPGINHDSWTPAFNRDDFMEWLFMQ